MALDPNALHKAAIAVAEIPPMRNRDQAEAAILAYLQHAGEGEAKPVGADANKLKLWFFRDLTDDERLKLFRLHGLPIEELRTLASQYLVFRRLFAAPHPHQASEGMVLVPREPTEAMIEAARVDWQNRVRAKMSGRLPLGDHRLSLAATYRSMVAVGSAGRE